MTRNGALAGIIVGAATVLVWKQFGWLGLYEIIPGFIFSTIAIVLVSRMGTPSASMLKSHAVVMEEARRIGV
jgi:sodium/proline symporter